jgi:hypothetical protein
VCIVSRMVAIRAANDRIYWQRNRLTPAEPLQHHAHNETGASLAAARLDKRICRSTDSDDAAFSRTTAFSPITAMHRDDPPGSSRILYRQVHAALKNGWLHRAHHQQAELQSKQATPILGEMITAAYAPAAVAAEGRFPVKSVAEAIGVSRSKSGGGPQERPQQRIGRPNRGRFTR